MSERRGTIGEPPAEEDQPKVDGSQILNPHAEDNVEQVQKAKAAAEETAQEEEYDSRTRDPEEEVWEGGPTFADVNAWKDQYGEDSIYVTSLTPTTHMAWRTLSRFEYRRLTKNLEQALSSGQVSQGEANLNNEEAIAEMCILYPPYSRQDSANHLAGVASTIAQQVMEASAFVSISVSQL